MKIKINIPRHLPNKEIDNRWSELKLENAFTPRQSFAFTSQANIGFLHGGYNADQGILDDMYTAKFNDPDDRKWSKIEKKGKISPGKLRYHTLNSYLYFLICIGGQKSQTDNNGDIFSFNLNTSLWSKLNITYQNNNQQIKDSLYRDSHSSVLYKKSLYVFGGYLLKKGCYTNTVLQIGLQNIENNSVSVEEIIFKSPQQLPRPRSNFASCVLDGEMYIFGGTDSFNFFSDFWKLNCQQKTWTQIPIQEQYWPEKRKGAVLVPYPEIKHLLLFGGMQTITKQQNDLSIYSVNKNKWVKIHHHTNNIYDPSPTIKQQVEDSPLLIQKKVKQEQKPQFRIGVINTSESHITVEGVKFVKSKSSYKDTRDSKYKNQYNHKVCKTQMSFHGKSQSIGPKTEADFYDRSRSIKKMSVVQQKRYRQFLTRKKKLLTEAYASYKGEKVKRPFSPISQCLNYTLSQIGGQRQLTQFKNPEFHLPKVIFDEKKYEVIGKKPCARDGHSAFSFEKNMYIIGGDRHMVSFNDTHILRMDKALQSIRYYL